MWSSSRRVLQDVVTHPSLVRSFSVTSCKNTVIVERWWQVPLAKEGSPATSRLYPRRHRIYKLVEDTTHAPKEKMELILTQTVPKLGGRGDTVSVKKSVGRNKLLPQGLAVYPSPENKDMFAEEMRLLREGTLEERMQTRTGQMTVEYLKRSSLKINSIPPMDNFELTKEIVCRQVLKKLGVVVPPHALRLPDEPIKELGDYWCEVTVNGIDTVRVPMSLMPYEDRLMKKQEMQPEVVSTAEAAISEAEEVVVKTVPAVVVDSAAEVVEGLETPLATASVMSEASAAQPAEAVEEAAASLETPLAEASVTPEASAAPPAEAAASLETPLAEASVTPEASAAAPPAEAVEEAAASLETPLAEASVTPEASAAAPPAEAVEEAAASVETPLAEASVMPEASAAPPAEAVASVETPLTEASVMPETSAAPPAEAVEEAAASVETTLAEASVTSEASAAPPAESVASVETPLPEASVTSEASAAPPKVSVTAETANDQPVPPTETPKKD